MKDSFIFYASFFDAIIDLEDSKRLQMYDSISYLALRNEEILPLNEECKRLFILIKPQILANTKKYEDGKKGKEYGKLGGRPKKLKDKEKEKTPVGFSEITPNENVNEKEKEKENVNVNVSFLEKEKYDPFFSQTKTFFAKEYEKVFGSHPYLSYDDAMKLTELKREYKNINELIPVAIERLKRIKFGDNVNFTPTANWLLKGNNFERVMNGEFEPKKTEMELLKEKLGID